MKKLTMLLAALVLLSGTVENSNATPVYYTFSGYVDAVSSSATGFSIGQAVNYTFLLNFDLLGSDTFGAVGSQVTQEIPDSPGSYDSFYVEYVSGTIMARPPTPPTNTYVANEGYLWNNGVFSMHASPTDFYLNYVKIDGKNVTVGSKVISRDFSAGYFVDSTLTLDSITPASSAVPEPSTMLLLGSGLLGLVGLNRRRKA